MTALAPRAGLDDLIGAISDCVIDPALARHLRCSPQRFGFHNAVLSVINTINQDMLIDVAVNIPHDELAARQLSGHSVKLWGGWARISSVPLEKPVLNS